MTYELGNSGPGFGQAQNLAGLNQLMGSQPKLLESYIEHKTVI